MTMTIRTRNISLDVVDLDLSISPDVFGLRAVHMGWHTSDIGWGQGFYIVHKTVHRQLFCVTLAVSWSPWEIAILTGGDLVW